MPPRSRMGIFPAESYGIDLSDVIYRGLQALAPDVKGRRVFLKPNFVEYKATTAINTDPAVIVGAAAASCEPAHAKSSSAKGPAIVATSSTCSSRPVCTITSENRSCDSWISIRTMCGRCGWRAGSRGCAAYRCRWSC